MPELSPFHQAARQYHADGLHPLPCEMAGKRPLVNWKEYQERQPTLAEIDAWWGANPMANVGLILGRGIFAVDIDSAEGRENLLAAGVTLPDNAPSVSTGKGAHVYLAGAAPDRVALVPGVDIRGVGYVVAPPSIHPSGAVYNWVVPFTAPPPAPAALIAMVQQPVRPVNAPGTDWLSQALIGVAEGGRDDTCTKIAGYFLGKGVPVEAVEVVLQAWAARCTPPFPADQVQKCVYSIAAREGTPAGPPMRLGEALAAVLADARKPKRKAAPTPFGSLNALLAGGLFIDPELIIVGARPSVGKSALASFVSLDAAKHGRGVLYVSLEMASNALVRRMLSQESGVRAEGLKTGDLHELELKALDVVAERMSGWPLWVTDDVYTTDQLDQTIGIYTPGQLDMVVVDYLQLADTADRMRDQRQRVEQVAKDLRRLVRKHSVTILALSSLSRPPKNVKEWRPTLADLRESGELEHAADQVWLLHRELEQTELDFNLAKQRDGRVGRLTLNFAGETLAFRETGQ